jgi:hypothetical protein
VAPTDTMIEAPKLDLFDGTGIAGGEDQGDAPGQLGDVGWPDAISDEVGRPGYLSNYLVDECLLPAEGNEECLLSTDRDDRSEPALFDRYYFPGGAGGEPVLVDMLPGGSEVERAAQEAEKRVALKREWCEARGVTYKVVVDMPSPVAF